MRLSSWSLVSGCHPGASNVVPGRCRLVIDARTTNPELMAQFVEEIERESAHHATVAGAAPATLNTLSDGQPVFCDPDLRGTLRQSAEALGLTHTDLASGAGHDTAFMSRICPSAMVFVPCRGGKSHDPEEWCERGQLAAGAAVLLQAVKAIDGQARDSAKV